ncbi:MAG: hypothetical protein HY672_04815 [Chloroflexi bacterium]|nr:hypothetical protein [Chloroflexota bacterium]
MSIQEKMRPGETIVSDHAPFYATSQRLIHYQEKDGVEELRDISYARLTSVEVVKLPRHKMMIAGTALTIGGIIMASMGFITSWPAIVFGIGALVYGGMGREAYYQFRANGMTKEEAARWRLAYWGNGNFIRTIRTITGERREL